MSRLDADLLAHSLARFTGSKAADPFVVDCTNEAIDLVTAHADTRLDRVPAAVLRRAVVEVGADLFHRRAARNGVIAFDETEVSASPVRIGRDPLAAARPLLAPYLGVGIA